MVVNQSLTCFMKSLKVWSSLKLMNKSGKEYELQPRIISQKKKWMWFYKCTCMG